MKLLTPPEIVAVLDRYITSQDKAKRALAVAIRNRWRSQQAHVCSRDFDNHRYLVSGPRGVGKTEVVRRAAQVIDAPFAHISAAQLAGQSASNSAAEAVLQSLVEQILPRYDGAKQAVSDVECAGIILIDGLDQWISVSSADDGRDPHPETAQQPLSRLLTTPSLDTRYGAISTADLLVFATVQQPSGRAGELAPELLSMFPRRIDLDGLNDDDLLHILTTTESSPIGYYVALLATEGLTVNFTSDGLDAVARESAELNRRIEDIGARRLAAVIEHVLDDLLFDPFSAPQPEITIDDEYVTARTMVDGDDEDLTDFIL